jgi:quercetin dioxygenase-like cupin family protein
MQETGATFDMPDGSAFRVLRSPSETAGELVELELAVPARSAAVPKHRHPGQEEEYDVLEGTFDVFVDGRWRALREGDSLTIAPGEAHAFRGASEPARVRNVHWPALDFLEYFQRLHTLAESGEIEKLKSPKTLIYTQGAHRARVTVAGSGRAPSRNRPRRPSGRGPVEPRDPRPTPGHFVPQ